jgi:hypothetical protein
MGIELLTTRRNQSEPRNESNVSFDVQNLSCGVYDYFNRDLIYQPEIIWSAIQGSATFLRESLIVQIALDSGAFRVEIPFRTVEAMIFSPRPATISLSLTEAPILFRISEDEQLSNQLARMTLKNDKHIPPATKFSRERLTELPCNHPIKHHEIIGQALVYRISVSAEDLHAKIEKIRHRGVLSPIIHNFHQTDPVRRPGHLSKSLKNFHSLLQESAKVVPFDILFQFQALVQNGYLLPETVGALLQPLAEQIQRDADGTRVRNPPICFAVNVTLTHVPGSPVQSRQKL